MNSCEISTKSKIPAHVSVVIFQEEPSVTDNNNADPEEVAENASIDAKESEPAEMNNVEEEDGPRPVTIEDEDSNSVGHQLQGDEESSPDDQFIHIPDGNGVANNGIEHLGEPDEDVTMDEAEPVVVEEKSKVEDDVETEQQPAGDVKKKTNAATEVVVVVEKAENNVSMVSDDTDAAASALKRKTTTGDGDGDLDIKKQKTEEKPGEFCLLYELFL